MFKILNVFGKVLKITPMKFRLFIFEIVSVTNLKIFVGFRYIVLKSIIHRMGDNVYIGKNTTIKNPQNIAIGSNVSIHDFSYIEGHGGLYIGNNVSIANSTIIISSDHTWFDKDKPIKYNPIMKKPIVIKDDVWIAAGVRILGNVTIGERSVIGAGAVVNKDISPNSLNVGVPAKKIKEI